MSVATQTTITDISKERLLESRLDQVVLDDDQAGGMGEIERGVNSQSVEGAQGSEANKSKEAAEQDNTDESALGNTLDFAVESQTRSSSDTPFTEDPNLLEGDLTAEDMLSLLSAEGVDLAYIEGLLISGVKSSDIPELKSRLSAEKLQKILQVFNMFQRMQLLQNPKNNALAQSNLLVRSLLTRLQTILKLPNGPFLNQQLQSLSQDLQTSNAPESLMAIAKSAVEMMRQPNFQRNVKLLSNYISHYKQQLVSAVGKDMQVFETAQVKAGSVMGRETGQVAGSDLTAQFESTIKAAISSGDLGAITPAVQTTYAMASAATEMTSNLMHQEGQPVPQPVLAAQARLDQGLTAANNGEAPGQKFFNAVGDTSVPRVTVEPKQAVFYPSPMAADITLTPLETSQTKPSQVETYATTPQSSSIAAQNTAALDYTPAEQEPPSAQSVAAQNAYVAPQQDPAPMTETALKDMPKDPMAEVTAHGPNCGCPSCMGGAKPAEPNKPYAAQQTNTAVKDPMAEVTAHGPNCGCPSCLGGAKPTEPNKPYAAQQTNTAVKDPMAEVTAHGPNCGCPQCSGQATQTPVVQETAPKTPPSIPPKQQPAKPWQQEFQRG